MSEDCNNILLNPLQRDGTHQRERLLAALKPDYVKVDERDIDEWLLYANKYAALLRFYDVQNIPDGDWAPFIQKDVSTLVAMVANADQQIESFKRQFDFYMLSAAQIETEADSNRVFSNVLVVLYNMASQLFVWQDTAIPELTLRKTLDRLIASLIDSGFTELIGYLARAKELGMPIEEVARIRNAQQLGQTVADTDLVFIDIATLRARWPEGEFPPQAIPFPNGIPAPGKNVRREVRRLTTLFRRFYEVMKVTVRRAPEFMEESLTEFPGHEPHMALFLTFLNLMKVARDHLNTLTKRHLDFYYQEVLQLEKRPETPDKVHLIFELAKNFKPYLIETDIEFAAGSDDLGNDLFYASDEELVVNQAKLDEVEGLKTIFIDKEFTETTDDKDENELTLAELGIFNISNIHAAANADTADGKEEDLPEDNPKWETLGSSSIPHAEIGFAIASPMLLLGEGTRSITLTFTFPNLNKVIEKYGILILKSELRQNVNIFLTGEKEWFEVTNKKVEIQFGEELDPVTQTPLASRSDVIFTLTLTPDDPPVVPYDSEVYLDCFDTAYPVVRFLMNNDGLQTSGDLDLNLFAGIEEYDADIPYLANEFVKITDDADVETIYRANADVQAINPIRATNDGLMVWEPISAANAIGYDTVTTNGMKVGLLVSYPGAGGALFRLNVKSTDVSPVDNTEVWATDVLQEQGNFNPEAPYTQGTLVSYLGKLYELEALSFDPIAPPVAADFWREIQAYSALLNNYLPARKMCADANNFYIARIGTTATAGQEPSTELEIWADVQTYQPTLYSEGAVFVDANDSSLAFEVEVAVDLSTLPALTNEWKTKTVWTDVTYVHGQYSVGDLTGDSGKIYEVQVPHTSVAAPSDQPWTNVNYQEIVANRHYNYGMNASERVGYNGELYKVNAVPIEGQVPIADLKIWENADYNETVPYSTGQTVGFHGELYLTLVSPIPGDLPDVSKRAWKEITFGPSTEYVGGDIVFPPDLGLSNVFQVYGTPDSATNTIFTTAKEPVWEDVTYKNASLYKTGDVVGVKRSNSWSKYRAKIDEPGEKPWESDLTTGDWELITNTPNFPDYDTDFLLSQPAFPRYPDVGTFVIGDNNTKVYKTLLAKVRAPYDLDVKGMTIDTSIIILSGNGPFSNGSFVSEKDDVSGDIVKVFLAKADSLAAPDLSQRIWEKLISVPKSSGNTPHLQGEYVRVPNSTGADVRVFRVRDTVQRVSVAPNINLDVWEKDIASVLEFSNSADAGEYVSTGSAPNIIIYRSEVDANSNPPGIELWAFFADVSTGNFDQGDFAEDNGLYYLANAIPQQNGSPIPPGGADVSIFSELPVKPFDPGDNINKNDLVSRDPENDGTLTFFQIQGDYIAENDAAEITPGKGLKIWDSADLSELDEYDTETVYDTGAGNIYVSYENTDGVIVGGYELISTVDRFGPAGMPNEWKAGGLVEPYDPTKEYSKNTFVSFVNSFFEAKATFTGISPNSGVTIWDPVVLADTPAYSSTISYALGDYAKIPGAESADDQYFRAGGGVIDLSPDEQKPIWEEEVKIKLYQDTTIFSPGEYVRFEELGENRYYHSLFNGGNVSPLSDPTLWSKAGTIDPYNKSKTYYTGMHVLYGGIVYRLLNDTSQPNDLRVVTGIAPNSDATSDPNWQQVPGSYPYKYFRDLAFEKLIIDISVLGMRNLLLENDQGVINADKPFRPFGTTPKKGGNFYIGNHEIFQKRLDGGTDDNPNISIELEWGDTPEVSFNTYYAHYIDDQTQPIVIGNNNHFTYALEVLQDGNWEVVPSQTGKPLFEDPNSTENSALVGNDEPPSKTLKINIPNSIYKDRKEDLLPFSAYSLKLDRGFIRFSLKKDFFHGQYAKSIAHQVSLEGNPTTEDPGVLEKKIPNEPYTPLINSFTLCYNASETLNFKGKGKGDAGDEVEQFFHIHPFGQGNFYPINEEPDDTVFASDRLVPIFDAPVYETDGRPLLGEADPFSGVQAHVHRDASGNLYIGIRDLQPPQNLHILFQVAEGSENPDRAAQRVIWSYLRHNRWIDFKDTEILSDATDGLLGSGIIKFSMPKGMKSGNTILSADLHWIRASVVDFADGVAQALAVRPQAILASYRNRDNDLTYLKDPLEANQISSLIRRRAEISKIVQPYASFDGRLVEQDEEYYVRVSERLRHKGRGIAIFDYERLVLEAFPDVYKVKCINHTYTYPGIDAKVIEDRYQEFLPGHVKLIVLPDLRNKNAVDRLRPRMSLKRMKEIYAYIQPRTSNFVTVAVKAPIFEEVRVTVEVVFIKGKDIGFFTQKLNEDLVAFLSPWLFDDQKDIVFGGKIRGAEIINFIDEQEYIDYITDFRMEQRADGDEIWNSLPELEAITCTSSSVLVSAETHIIQVKTDDKCLNQPS